MDAIKHFFKDDKNTVTHKEEVHQKIETKSTTKPDLAATGAVSGINVEFAADKGVLEAHRLKQEACKKLEISEATAAAAKLAQTEVERAAARANIITNQALRQEVEGQKTLVEAGQKLMEAGAKLQQEAAEVNSARGTSLTYVQTGAVQQNTSVKAAEVQAAQMQVLQNRVVNECRPVLDTQVRTERIETHSHRATESH